MDDAGRFDELLDAGRDDGPSYECPVCTGNSNAEPCSEECAVLVQQLSARLDLSAEVRGSVQAVLTGAAFAKQYVDEGDVSTTRLIGTLRQIAEWALLAADTATLLQPASKTRDTLPSPSMNEAAQ